MPKKRVDIGAAAQMQARLRTRIVGHAMVDPTTLVPNPHQWRIHTAQQLGALSGILTEVGWVRDILVNQTTGHIVDGHGRLVIALQEEEPAVPVSYCDLSLEEERLVLAVLDPLGAMAEQDDAKLNDLIGEVTTGDAALQSLLGELWTEPEAMKPKPGEGEETISPELFERHDYLVILFENELDWQAVCERFEIASVYTAPVGQCTLRRKGIGRVLKAQKLLEALDMPSQEVSHDAGGQ